MKYYIYLTDLTQKRKIRKIKFRILEKANELINLALSISNVSIACSSPKSYGERKSDGWKAHHYVSTYCRESNNGLER